LSARSSRRATSAPRGLVEIEAQLKNPNLDENTRFNLEAQARAARVRINAAKAQQH